MSNKAKVSFKIPGKTFLIGEYLALFGGPSLVLTTNPCFEVHFQEGIGVHPFHLDSPAGKYINLHADYFCNWDIHFTDPYEGQGGFGASTAQFIAVSLMRTHSDDFSQENFFTTKKQVAIDVWNEYQDIFSHKMGHVKTPLRPSGADLVAQVSGELDYFDGLKKSHETLLWPFADKDVLLYKTAQKISTHDHLERVRLSGEILVTQMRPIVQRSIAALKSGQWEAWLLAQVQFSDVLAGNDLVHPDTELLLEKIRPISGVISARGCGALGADVIAITIDKENKTEVSSAMSAFSDVKYIASLQDDQAYGTIIDSSMDALINLKTTSPREP